MALSNDRSNISQYPNGDLIMGLLQYYKMKK